MTGASMIVRKIHASVPGIVIEEDDHFIKMIANPSFMPKGLPSAHTEVYDKSHKTCPSWMPRRDVNLVRRVVGRGEARGDVKGWGWGGAREGRPSAVSIETSSSSSYPATSSSTSAAARVSHSSVSSSSQHCCLRPPLVLLRCSLVQGTGRGYVYYTDEGMLVIRHETYGIMGRKPDYIVEDYLTLEEEGTVIVDRMCCQNPRTGARAEQLQVVRLRSEPTSE